jgi:hypothetical protein
VSERTQARFEIPKSAGDYALLLPSDTKRNAQKSLWIGRASYRALQNASFSRDFKPVAGELPKLRVMDFKEL